MGFNKGGGEAKPVFLPGQKDMAAEILMNVLGPLALGGAPDPGTQIQGARAREGLGQTLAMQGITGSGLAAKSAVGLEQGLAANDARQRFDVINRVFSSLGQSSSQSSIGVDTGLRTSLGLGS
jgi:hypothetical protein